MTVAVMPDGLRRAGRYVGLAPWVMMIGTLSGGILAGFGSREHSMPMQGFGGVIGFVCIFAFPVFLGRAAALLGKSWLVYAVLPILFPMAYFIAWINLWKTHRELKDQSSAIALQPEVDAASVSPKELKKEATHGTR